MTKLEELRAAFEAATPGADVRHATVDTVKGIFCGNELLFGGSFCDYYEPSDEEYRFIALAHNNMPALLEAVEALNHMIQSFDELRNGWHERELHEDAQVTIDRAQHALEKLK